MALTFSCTVLQLKDLSDGERTSAPVGLCLS